MRLVAHSTRPPITVMGIKAARAATAWVKRANKGTEERMREVSNRDAAWAERAVAQLLRDAVAWLLLVRLAELGIGPPP
jgi:hypothetical protein